MLRPVHCLLIATLVAPVTVAHAQVTAVDAAYAKWRAALPRAGAAESAAKRRARAGTVSKLAAFARASAASTSRRAIDALLEIAVAEPHRPLRAFAGVELLRRERALSQAQLTRYIPIKQAMFPPRPPTPTTGQILIRHFVGDEFFRGEVASYRRKGFSISRETTTSAQARKGRLVVTLRKGDTDIFRDMNDGKVDVVLFSGHSDVGGVAEQALRLAPREKGQKLIVMLKCVGMQVVPMVSARFGRAQILTTRNPSYADLDLNMLHALLAGLEVNDTWAGIRKRAKAGGDARNYVLPDDPAIALGWDLDRDGRLDLGPGRTSDAHFDVAIERPRPFAHTLLSALGYLESSHRYYAEDTPEAVFTVAAARGRLVAVGVGAGTAGRVSSATKRRVAGRDVAAVQLNSAYGRHERTYVAAALVLELHEHTMTVLKGRATPRDRLRGLFFALDYVYRFAPYNDEANRVVRVLTKAYGYPTRDYTTLQPVLFMEKEASASNRQLTALSRLLGIPEPR